MSQTGLRCLLKLRAAASSAKRRSAIRRILAVCVAACGLMCALAIIRWNVWSDGSDTGTFAQTAANAFSGFRNGMEAGTHFRFHFSPVLALLWPVVAIFKTPLALQIVQVLLILACPLLVAAIVKAYVPEPWPLRCALLVLLYPPLLANAFSEFHELAFYPLLLLVLLWAADRARWTVFALAALLLAAIREDAALDLIVIGAALTLAGVVRRHTRERGLLAGEPIEPERLCVAGIGLAALSTCALAMYAFVILPRTGPWAPSHFYEYPFAHGPLQTALAIFTHPVALLHAIATPGRLTYVLEALVPLAFLPLFSRWSLLALPGLAGILLASDASVWRMGMHYVLLWAPLLLLAAIAKLVALVRARSDRAAARWWTVAAGACVVFLIAFNPMHPAHYLKREAFSHGDEALRALACVPRNAPVAMHDEWYAHEALAYPASTVLGANPQRFAGYLVYADDWRNPIFARALPRITAARARGDFTDVCTFGTVHVLRATAFRTAE